MKKKNNIDGYERLKIGSHIRKWRGVKDMKQKELAAALRISEAAVSNMENDMTDLTLSQLEDIALALEIDIEQLFSDPQDQIAPMRNGNESKNENIAQTLMDKETVYALIGSIQQKDNEIKSVLNNMVSVLDKFISYGSARN